MLIESNALLLQPVSAHLSAATRKRRAPPLTQHQARLHFTTVNLNVASYSINNPTQHLVVLHHFAGKPVDWLSAHNRRQLSTASLYSPSKPRQAHHKMKKKLSCFGKRQTRPQWILLIAWQLKSQPAVFRAVPFLSAWLWRTTDHCTSATQQVMPSCKSRAPKDQLVVQCGLAIAKQRNVFKIMPLSWSNFCFCFFVEY